MQIWTNREIAGEGRDIFNSFILKALDNSLRTSSLTLSISVINNHKPEICAVVEVFMRVEYY